MDIAILITLLYISYKASKSLRNESEVLKEFNISNTLSFLVFIYPLGPVLLIFGAVIPHIILYPLVAACFLPQLLLAIKQKSLLELTGTDRANKAKEALSLASLGAIVGLLYLAVVLVLVFAITSVATSNHY